MTKRLFEETAHRGAILAVLALLQFGCAGKSSPQSVGSEKPCTVSDSSGCGPPSTPAPPAKPHEPADEVSPFYESVAPGGLETERAREPEEEVIGAEAEEEIAGSVQKPLSEFDIPIVINQQVQKWVDYFQTRGKERFTEYLERSGRYVPMMRRILKENGLPEDLVYLSMIESGFKTSAYSRAKASGQWQFIKGTGARYGLRVTWWVDERRDPEKSTIAAAQHLKDLYDQFDHWYLAAAGYNAGAGKVSKAIYRYSTEDFWEMSKHRYLKPETKNYVPKLIAAALVAKNPDRYGFKGIRYENPLEYDKVLIPQPTQLQSIADALEVPLKQLQDLNPELRRGITPPDTVSYEMNVPKGYRERFIAAYPEIQKKSASGALRHIVRRGETLSQISRHYGIESNVLIAFNQLSSQKVRPGQQLAIPTWQTSTVSVARFSDEEPQLALKGGTEYRVRRGDTLWSISRRFGVTVSEIRRWNRINDPTELRPGKKLRLVARADPPILEAAPPRIQTIPAAKSAAKSTAESWKVHKVRSGENLWTIAKQHGVTVQELSEWNRLDADETIFPGRDLRVRLINL